MTKVFIRKGKWRDRDVSGMSFPAVSDTVMFGRNGPYVTVSDAINLLGSTTEKARIYLDNKNSARFEGEAMTVESQMSEFGIAAGDEEIDDEVGDDTYFEETEEEIITRINDRFAILSEMSHAAAQGVIRSLIVTGSPGVGKSFGVEKVLSECGTSADKIDYDADYEVIRGSISPIGLYKKLYQYRQEGKVVVFDDSDVVFFDQISLGILKAALDTSKIRTLSWETNSRDLEEQKIPRRFMFEGSIIFITNMDLENTRAKTLQPHFDAIISRSHYLDLTVKTNRDKYLRIKSLVNQGSILGDYHFGKEREGEILDFIYDNMSNLRELSLRTTIKIADIAKMNPTGWKRICSLTCCR